MTAPGRPSGSAHAMLLSAKGYSCDAIADILSAHRTTVSLWIDAWHAKGLAGLRDEPRPGRPPIYSAAERARLQALVDEQPHQLKAAQARLEAETGKTASPRTVKRCLKNPGIASSAHGSRWRTAAMNRRSGTWPPCWPRWKTPRPGAS